MGNFLPNRNNNASSFFAPTYVTLGDPVQTEGEPQISVPFDRHELIACDPSGSAGTGAAGPGVAYPAPGEGREVWPRRRTLHALNPPEIRSVPNQPPPPKQVGISNPPVLYTLGCPSGLVSHLLPLPACMPCRLVRLAISTLGSQASGG